MRMFSNGFKFALVASAAAALIACGGGSSTPAAQVAANNLTATVTPTTGAALTKAFSGETFTFPSGVSALGTTGSTTVKITDAATPTFVVTAPGGSYSGNLSYGSCIFTITQVTGTLTNRVGQVFTINPCTFTVNTAGAITGATRSTGVTWTLGQATSGIFNFPVTLNADGTAVVNASSLGTVTLVASTGAGG